VLYYWINVRDARYAGRLQDEQSSHDFLFSSPPTPSFSKNCCQMNLASRCREAIGRVAQMKKELASNQRRAAEALAKQRRLQQTTQQQQQQQPPSSSSKDYSGTESSVVTQSPSEKAALSTSSYSLSSPEPSPNAAKAKKQQSASASKAAATAVAVALSNISPPLASAQPPAAASAASAVAPVPSSAVNSARPRPSPRTYLVSSDDFENDDDVNGIEEGANDQSYSSTPSSSPEKRPATRGSTPAEDLADTEKETKEEEDWDAVVANLNKSAEGTKSPTRDPIFPHSASPKIVRGVGSYNEGYPGDITSAQVRAEHAKLHSGSMERLSGFVETDDDAQSEEPSPRLLQQKEHPLLPPTHAASPKLPSSDEQHRSNQNRLEPFDCVQEKSKGDKCSLLSSIDAFEASFAITDFPDSFSPKENAVEGDANLSANNTSSSPDASAATAYNPFSTSPDKKPIRDWKTDEVGTASTSSLEDSAAPVDNGVLTVSGANASWEGSTENGESGRVAHPPTVSDGSSSGESTSPRNDPPGRDRTSPRKQQKNAFGYSTAMQAAVDAVDGTMISSSPHSSIPVHADNVSLVLPASSAPFSSLRRSPVPSDSSNTKLPMASSASSSSVSSSSNRTPQKSPTATRKTVSTSSPTLPTTPTSNSRDGYITPPHATMTPPGSSRSSITSAEPKRPEKAGYDVARARYDKALQPRSSGGTSHTKKAESISRSSRSKESPPSDEKSRNADPTVFTSSQLRSMQQPMRAPPPDKASLWKGADFLPSDEEDGDIPLRSNLSRSAGNSPATGVVMAGDGLFRTTVGESKTRSRPWDKLLHNNINSPAVSAASSATGSSPRKGELVVNDDDGIDPSNSPLSRLRASRRKNPILP